MFKFFQKVGSKFAAPWRSEWSTEGLVISQAESGTELSDPLLPAYLAQLQDDGYAVSSEASLSISWDSLYEALESPGYTELPQVLCLPPWTANRPEPVLNFVFEA